MTDFALRPMEPTDGPAIDALMRTEAQTTAVSMTTRYRHDIYEAFLAQHPTLFGVVAEASPLIASGFSRSLRLGGDGGLDRVSWLWQRSAPATTFRRAGVTIGGSYAFY